MKILVEAGARVDLRSRNGSTPLHNVARFDEDGTATAYLLERGVNPNLAGHRRRTPLHIAVEQRPPYAAVVRAFLRGGADVNARDEQGITPLHLAAMGGKLDIVTLLLENRADINARDNDGRTPLSHALEREHHDVVKLLRKKGGL